MQSSKKIPTRALEALSPVCVICGHYGVGKTNFAVNLAIDLARDGYEVTLCDLDIVNPYFRATEQRSLLEDNGVRLIAPVFAERGSSLDAPSLRGTVATAVERAWADDSRNTYTIIDAGGDDVGATALGRFAHAIEQGPYSMWYVLNFLRNLTKEPQDTVKIMREIEAASHLSVTGLVDNAHLKQETTWDVLTSSAQFVNDVSTLTNLPLVCKIVPRMSDTLEYVPFGDKIPDRFDEGNRDLLYPVDIVVKNPWE